MKERKIERENKDQSWTAASRKCRSFCFVTDFTFIFHFFFVLKKRGKFWKSRPNCRFEIRQKSYFLNLDRERQTTNKVDSTIAYFYFILLFLSMREKESSLDDETWLFWPMKFHFKIFNICLIDAQMKHRNSNQWIN